MNHNVDLNYVRLLTKQTNNLRNKCKKSWHLLL